MAQHNDGMHILNITKRQGCQKHEALIGHPCFRIKADKGGKEFWGICNRRAVKAGANGKVSDSSYQLKKRKDKSS